MDEEVLEALKVASAERLEGGVTYRCLALADMRRIAHESGLSNRELSALALESGLLPLRYVKNIGTLGLDGQARLLRSKVVVLGAGGIGGQAAELLVRMGIGTLVLVDPDIFDETNLNRQNFASGDALGMAKVEIVCDRLLEINHDVEVTGVRAAADRENLPGLLDGADVAIDALDNLDDRLLLQEACASAGVVMVHGAIAGTSLQATTIYPGDRGLAGFAPLPGSGGKTKGIETETGNPATTPAMAAVIQVQEAVQVVLDRTPTLRGRMLYLDLADWTVDFIELSG